MIPLASSYHLYIVGPIAFFIHGSCYTSLLHAYSLSIVLDIVLSSIPSPASSILYLHSSILLPAASVLYLHFLHLLPCIFFPTSSPKFCLRTTTAWSPSSWAFHWRYSRLSSSSFPPPAQASLAFTCKGLFEFTAPFSSHHGCNPETPKSLARCPGVTTTANWPMKT